MEIFYLEVLILKWLEANSCWTAFANFLSFDATTIAAKQKTIDGKILSNPRYMSWLKLLQENSLLNTSKSPVGNLFINSNAKEGPDSAIKGWRGFFNAWGMIWDIILNVLSSKPLLRDINGKPGSTYSAMPSRKVALNCITGGKIQAVASDWKIS